jgi:hypothetical protein
MTSPIEVTICNRLVTKALQAGYMISVHDGEEYALKRSTSKRAVIEAMRSTDADTIVFRNADGSKAGAMLLIYGNGEDVISDYSDNAAMNALAAAAID